MPSFISKVNEYLYSGKSGIHSNGLFALKNIPKGKKIIQYTGKIISKKEGSEIENKQSELAKSDSSVGATYIFELDDENDLDGNTENNPAKYINHSCEPNCEFRIENKEIWIYTKREIKKGEEITYNYGFEWNPTEYKKHPCKCGSKNCVGYILEEEAWEKLKTKKH